MKTKMAVLACSAFLVATSAQAALLNIDFGTGGTYSGAAVVGGPGDVWNAVDGSNTTTGALNDSSGTPGPITLTKSGVSGAFGGSDFSNTGAIDLVSDQIYVDTTTATLTLNNVPAGVYDLYVYENRGNATETTEFQVTDANGASGFVLSTADNSGTTGFHTPEDYLLFASVVPTGGGQLTIQFRGVFDPYGAINGLQLLAVPEPSSLALLGFGLIACLAGPGLRRRRTRG